MSIPVLAQNQQPDQKPGMIYRWLINAIIVWLALLAASLTFHAFGNTLESFLPYFNSGSIGVFIIYGIVFALTYDRISGIWHPGTRRKRISLLEKDQLKNNRKSLLIRMFDGILIGIGLSIIFYGARYMASGGMLGDTDGDGVTDTSDGLGIVILAISALAMESGGRTESDDDEEDKTSPTATAPKG